jgi:hypothetical protein
MPMRRDLRKAYKACKEAGEIDLLKVPTPENQVAGLEMKVDTKLDMVVQLLQLILTGAVVAAGPIVPQLATGGLRICLLKAVLVMRDFTVVGSVVVTPRCLFPAPSPADQLSRMPPIRCLPASVAAGCVDASGGPMGAPRLTSQEGAPRLTSQQMPQATVSAGQRPSVLFLFFWVALCI